MKRTLIATVLAGLLLLMIPMAVSADSGVIVVGKTGDGEWIDNNTWQVDIYPGETKSTTLALRNSSSSSLGVEVSVAPDSLDSGNLVFKLNKTVFVMYGGLQSNVILTVKASGNATPGTYTTELTIKSEVPPRPSRPTPVTPVVIEPEEEPMEPEVVEPTEPTEPEVDIPEEEEPIEEPIEPIEPVEPIEPPEPEEPIEPVGPEDIIPIEEPCRWSLLDSILAGLVAIMLGLDIWQWRKQRA